MFFKNNYLIFFHNKIIDYKLFPTTDMVVIIQLLFSTKKKSITWSKPSFLLQYIYTMIATLNHTYIVYVVTIIGFNINSTTGPLGGSDSSALSVCLSACLSDRVSCLSDKRIDCNALQLLIDTKSKLIRYHSCRSRNRSVSIRLCIFISIYTELL